MKNLTLPLFACFLFCSNILFSQDIFVDSTFSQDGKNLISFSPFDDKCNDMILQPDGKILMIGFSETGQTPDEQDFAIVRLLPNGELDPSFGDGGKVTTDFEQSHDTGYDGILQDDGKIIVVGVSELAAGGFPDDIAIARYLENGDLDATFGNGGKVNNDFDGKNDIAKSVIIQDDGKILVTGLVVQSSSTDADEFIARYNSDGTLDPSFGQDGRIYLDLLNGNSNMGERILLQDDGKILVTGFVNSGILGEGRNIYLRRYNPDGSVDLTFNQNGYNMVDFFGRDDWPQDMTLQADGKILVCGYAVVDLATSNLDYALIRFNTNGTLDSTFSEDGKSNYDIAGRFDWPSKVIVQDDGKILVSGHSKSGEDAARFLAIRTNPDGTIDETFGDNGKITNEFMQDDPSIWDIAKSMILQPDGKIIVGGYSQKSDASKYDFSLVRYLSSLVVGTIDFDPGTMQTFIYPNPVQSETTLEYELLKNETLSISLYNTSGIQVQSFVRAEQRMAGAHQETFAIAPELPAGVYFLVISNAVGQTHIKLVKD